MNIYELNYEQINKNIQPLYEYKDKDWINIRLLIRNVQYNLIYKKQEFRKILIKVLNNDLKSISEIKFDIRKISDLGNLLEQKDTNIIFLKNLNIYAIHDPYNNFYKIFNIYINDKKVIMFPLQVDESLVNEIYNKIVLPKSNEKISDEKRQKIIEEQKRITIEALKRKRSPIIMATGTGKTIVAMAILQYLYEKGLKNLYIIVPYGKKQKEEIWEKQKKEFGFNFEAKILTIQEAIKEFFKDEDIIKNFKKIPYKKLENILKQSNIKIDCLIVDEAHKITSFTGRGKKSYKLIKTLSSVSDYIYLLTATPFKNNLLDYYGILSILGYNVYELEYILKSRKKSKKSRKSGIKKEIEEMMRNILMKQTSDLLNKLKINTNDSYAEKMKYNRILYSKIFRDIAIISSLSYEINRDIKILENPEIIKIYDERLRDIFIYYLVIPFYVIAKISHDFDELSDKSKKELEQILFGEQIDEDNKKIKDRMKRTLITLLFAIFRKYITLSLPYISGFELEDENKLRRIIEDHLKIQKLLEIINNHPNEKIIIYVYHAFAPLLKELIEKKTNRKVYVYFGQKKDNLEEFKNSENGIIIVGIRAGGHGLNLENVNIMVFYEYWWTYAEFYQAINRIIRVTSKSKQKKIYLLATDPLIDLEDIEISMDDLRKKYYGDRIYEIILGLIERNYLEERDLEPIGKGEFENKSILSLFAQNLYNKKYASIDLWMLKNIKAREKLNERTMGKILYMEVEESLKEIYKNIGR